MIPHKFSPVTITAVILLSLFPASSLAMPADEVVPIIDRKYFPVVHEVMLNAKKSIICVMGMAQLSVNHPFGGESLLLRDLIGAKNRGLKVRMILEDNPERNNKYAYNFLKDAGVAVAYDTEPVTTHSTFIVIDDELTILGSHNWTFGGLRINHEASVLIKSKEVAKAFSQAFEQIAVKEEVKE
ncbi:MAG: phospholipase D-like domain-containing protein [Candidatus Brocadiales bacterium]